MALKGVIFDLDGVIVSTDEQHYKGWKRIADEEGIYFDREINMRLRGVSRMESLEILLERAEKEYGAVEKAVLAERKNNYYKELIKGITPADILPGVDSFLRGIKAAGIKCAIGSSSKNTRAILAGIGLDSFFDFVADGTMIKNSKPAPDVFLIAAEGLGLEPQECLVIEDAEAGVIAGKAAGMKVMAVASAFGSENADISVKDLSEADMAALKNLFT